MEIRNKVANNIQEKKEIIHQVRSVREPRVCGGNWQGGNKNEAPWTARITHTARARATLPPPYKKTSTKEKESVDMHGISLRPPLRVVCIIGSIHLVSGVSRSVSSEQWASLLLSFLPLEFLGESTYSSSSMWWAISSFFPRWTDSPTSGELRLAVWRWSRLLAEHSVTVDTAEDSGERTR